MADELYQGGIRYAIVTLDMKFDYYIEDCGLYVRPSGSGARSSEIMSKQGGLKKMRTGFRHNF